MALASVALADTRVRLNDVAATFFTDAILIPYLQIAHRELQLKIHRKQNPVFKEASAITTVAALATTITSPADLIQPLKLEERLGGSAADVLFDEMTEKDFETNIPQIERLVFWAWREEAILTPGATANREVRIYYLKGIAVPTVAGSSLGILQSETFLGARTAEYAARYILQDSNRAAELKTDADESLKDVLLIGVRNQQAMPARRRPYGQRFHPHRFFD